MSLDDDALAELRELEANHRLRIPRIVDGAQGPRIIIDGHEVVNFASNDYLGLAGDPRLAQAAAAAFEAAGSGSGASRLIVGNHREHVELELAAADWMRCGGVRLFNTGYAANVGVISGLLRAGDVVFSDELNHASIIDGCRLSRADVVVFPHADYRALEAALSARHGRRTLVVSESVFSMDGDIADVEALAALCKRHDASFMLDEAHAVGAVGPEGRGIAAERGVVPDLVVGTFGKALGSFGAFVATTRSIADLLWNRARSLVFSTAAPPGVSAVSRAALAIVRGAEGDRRRVDLAAHARRLRELVRDAGGAPTSAIVPLVIGSDPDVMARTELLLAEGVFVQGIRPPTVPVGTARLRIGLSAAHTVQQVEILAKLLMTHRVSRTPHG